MTSRKSKNIQWHELAVTREDREKLLHQKGVVLWFTGLSGSGKSTLANAVARKLHEMGHLTVVLDGDNIRHGLNGDLGFSPEDRSENIRRIGQVARLFSDAGVIVLTAFISPFREDRSRVRALLKPGRFLEIHVDCDLETCESRDPKGLYKLARDGKISDFTGISSPYEAPEHPEFSLLNRDENDLESNTQKIIKGMGKQGFLNGDV